MLLHYLLQFSYTCRKKFWTPLISITIIMPRSLQIMKVSIPCLRWKRAHFMFTSNMTKQYREGRIPQTYGVPHGEWVFQTATLSLMLFHSLLQDSSAPILVYGDSPCHHPSHEVCLSKVELLVHTWNSHVRTFV